MPEIKYNGEIQEIMVKLARIEQKLDDIPVHDVHKIATFNDKVREISKKVDGLAAQVAADRKVTVGVSAVVAGLMLAFKMNWF